MSESDPFVNLPNKTPSQFGQFMTIKGSTNFKPSANCACMCVCVATKWVGSPLEYRIPQFILAALHSVKIYLFHLLHNYAEKQLQWEWS